MPHSNHFFYFLLESGYGSAVRAHHGDLPSVAFQNAR